MGKNNNSKKKNDFTEPRINHEIRGHSEVRLIYKEHSSMKSENDFNKVVSWKEAVETSKRMGLDLIELNGNVTPPIIRLADYSKYLYEQKKMMKQRNKNTTVLKEIQLKVNISYHDLEIKANKAKSFLEDGDKVKVVLTMRGRELTRREESKKAFYQFVELMIESGLAAFDTPIRDEDQKCFVILKKK